MASEDGPYRKVLDLEYECLDGDEYVDFETGKVYKDGLIDRAMLLRMRKRLAAAGRQSLAEFYDYMVVDLDLSESTASQTVTRVNVAFYETGGHPWRKLEDWRIADSYHRFLHTDLRKLAAWMQLQVAPDGAYRENDPYLEEMVAALLESRFWRGGSRFELLERYLVRRTPARKKGKRLRGAPQPPRSEPKPPQESVDSPDTSESVHEPKTEKKAPRASRAVEAAPGASHLPEVLLIDEVASLFRLGRNTAYQKFHVGELPGGRKIGRRLIRFSRDAVLEHLGLPSPEPDAEINNVDVIDVKGLAALLRTSRNTIYEQLGNGDLVLPDDAIVSKRPRRFSRRPVLDWLGPGERRAHRRRVYSENTTPPSR